MSTPALRIEQLILTIRGQRVMLDSDTAMRSQIVTASSGFRAPTAIPTKRNIRYHPYAFTEHGAIMLASILNSPIAVTASVRVVRAFVFLREQLQVNKELAQKFAELEGRVGEHDEAIQELFEAIRQLLEPPKDAKRGGIGFHVRETASRYRIRTRRRF